ncbi:MAG: hypothetical protein CMH50_06545 [Myxococcales bacterium]|nr:hypothetical protein [Myxococcales bacterium]
MAVPIGESRKITENRLSLEDASSCFPLTHFPFNRSRPLSASGVEDLENETIDQSAHVEF